MALHGPALPAIGSPVIGGTTGSVLFIDAAGNAGQNNSSFFWDNTNLRATIARAWIYTPGTAADNNLFIGPNAGNLTITSGVAQNNTGVGTGALTGLTSGNANTAFGYNSINVCAGATLCTAVGSFALSAVTTGGNNNTAVGSDALGSLTTGTSNTSLGVDANWQNLIGNQNVAIGALSQYSNLASDNIAIGYAALYTDTTGNQNVAIGTNAMNLNLSGSQSIAIGYQAMQKSTAGTNIGIGWEALLNNTSGTLNCALGLQALFTNSIGGSNVAIGNSALFSYTGNNNTAVGHASLFTTSTGNQNVGCGYLTLFSATSSNNTAIGYQALRNITSGAGNTALGNKAGFSAANTVTVSNCIFIGNQADSSADGITNSIAIGFATTVGTSNTTVIGNGSTATTLINGNLGIGGGSSFGGGSYVVFVPNAGTTPTSNPTAGGILYASAGAGTWRGSGGTITAFGPAGPHCGKCGYDFWDVAAENPQWGAHLRKCGWCGTTYKKGPKQVLDRLTAEQKAELIYE